MAEAVNQVAFQIIADDTAITMAAQAGQLELNAFLPVIAKNLFEMLDLLSSMLPLFIERCIKGIEANTQNCYANIEGSFTLVTALIGYIGYDKASEVALISQKTGETVREIIIKQKLMDEKELEEVFKPQRLTSPAK